MSTVMIEASSVTVRLGDTLLLPPTTFAASTGQFWCITGPNGSGKTTLLRVLSGRVSLSSGSCTVMGRPMDSAQSVLRRDVASLVGSVPVASDMTLREQIGMVAASWFGNSGRTATTALDVAEEFGLGALLERFPHELSSGQLQLFLLALVMVRPGGIVLLDEPERHLDAQHVGILVGLLRRRCREGATVIVSTHEPTLVDAADHCLEMAHG